MKFELIAFDLRIYSQRIYIVAKDAAAAAQRSRTQFHHYLPAELQTYGKYYWISNEILNNDIVCEKYWAWIVENGCDKFEQFLVC